MSLKNRTSDIVDSLLVAVAEAGSLGLVVIAPNGLQAIEPHVMKLITGKDRRREARRIARYMRQQKLISIQPADGDNFKITLTEKGKTRSKQARFDRLEIDRGNWDEKWRVVMFDIPEQHKTTRDYISRHLRLIGFKPLQRSVFIYPYPVDEFVALLNEIFPEVENHLNYMTAEDIDQHNKLVKQFASIL